jgi:CheY-like chemotaxis protein
VHVVLSEFSSSLLLSSLLRALTDAGFQVDTARNGFIGLNKMLASAFPNAPVSPSNSNHDSKTRTKISVEGKRERFYQERNEIDLEVKDSSESAASKGKERTDRPPLTRSTSSGYIAAGAELDPFDFILMDIQMPVMGKTYTLFLF